MHKGCIKPAYNYSHYATQRNHKTKILKRSLYGLLDNRDELKEELEYYEKKHREAEAFLAKMWGE